jgi:hypothetical protein
LILVYYLVITPCALIRRAFRRESVLPGIDRRASTYWAARRGSQQPGEKAYKRS